MSGSRHGDGDIAYSSSTERLSKGDVSVSIQPNDKRLTIVANGKSSTVLKHAKRMKGPQLSWVDVQG
jgi:hypothetical protein